MQVEIFVNKKNILMTGFVVQGHALVYNYHRAYHDSYRRKDRQKNDIETQTDCGEMHVTLLFFCTLQLIPNLQGSSTENVRGKNNRCYNCFIL